MIEGITLIPRKETLDDRGRSCKLFSREVADIDIDELYLSNSKKYVIRGIHFQDEPYAQRKTVTVLKGRIRDVVIDLRPDSNSFLAVDEFDIDERAEFSLLIPKGCGHGFLALENENIILYGIEGKYNRDFDNGVLWNSINYDWNIKSPILSKRDQEFLTLEKYLLERNKRYEGCL